MAFLVSSVPVNILAIAGLVAPCISQHFLETSGFPASGASCLRTITFSYPGGSFSVPLPFAIVADVRADIVLPAEWCVQVGATASMFFASFWVCG